NWADQLGRVPLAVPGPVNSTSSMGTHEAIRSGKAILVSGAEQVRQELAGLGADEAAPAEPLETAYDCWSPRMRAVYDALDWSRPAAASHIAEFAQTPHTRTVQYLSVLAAAGFAERTQAGWRVVRRADER